MSDPIGGITSTALSGLLAAENQADSVALNLAGGTTPSPFGSTGPALTGTQPSGIAGQVQQATGGTDLATQLIDLINARNSFAANIDTLNTGNRIARQAIDILA
jgi:flagellar basal body rod protein FlgC